MFRPHADRGPAVVSQPSSRALTRGFHFSRRPRRAQRSRDILGGCSRAQGMPQAVGWLWCSRLEPVFTHSVSPPLRSACRAQGPGRCQPSPCPLSLTLWAGLHICPPSCLSLDSSTRLVPAAPPPPRQTPSQRQASGQAACSARDTHSSDNHHPEQNSSWSTPTGCHTPPSTGL